MTLLFVSYQVVFIDDQKLHDKKVNIIRSKKAFKVREKKEKAFIIIYKELSVQRVLSCETLTETQELPFKY